LSYYYDGSCCCVKERYECCGAHGCHVTWEGWLCAPHQEPRRAALLAQAFNTVNYERARSRGHACDANNSGMRFLAVLG